MAATKEATMAKEHHPELDIHVFMMDMRAFSKGYWEYFERARDRYGIHFHRSRVSSLHEDRQTHQLVLQYLGEDQSQRKESFDLVVLAVGMEISESVKTLGRRLDIDLDEYGFCQTVTFDPVQTSKPGIFVAGPFHEPKDIPEAVVEASGAAAAAAVSLSPARFSLTTELEYPAERDVTAEAPRIGVFVCHCGSNIGGFLDVPGVTGEALSLPCVVHAEHNLYTCSQDSIRHITAQIQELRLNRVVVASCTPLTHQPLFQDSLRAAGLNPYLFEMANIRNHCSWVHSRDRQAATVKAIELVRMAVARAAHLEAQHLSKMPVERAALVVGGGTAGMTAALTLAEQGFPVHLVEKEAQLGGHLRRLFTPLPSFAAGDRPGTDPQQWLAGLIDRIQANPMIAVHLSSRVSATRGFMGNFTSRIETLAGAQQEVSHGATILATGAQEYRGPDYGYGIDPRVMTQLELEKLIEERLAHVQPEDSSASEELQSVVMIQCVGPADKFCSRICCTVALKNALRIKAKSPNTSVTVLYRDMRTYGFKERLYTESRKRGVVFIRYDEDHLPEIENLGLPDTPLVVRAWDPQINRFLRLPASRLVLSMPVVPDPETRQLAALFKVPLDAQGFFLESHVKLRPVDFSTEGIFMAGMAHYPKLLEETIIQAKAAASRAARILSRESISAGGRVAVVDATRCTGCLTCVRICPFEVPRIQVDLAGVGNILGAAFIEPTVCQGCGVCAAECPAEAIQLRHYTDQQMNAKVDALLVPTSLESQEIIYQG